MNIVVTVVRCTQWTSQTCSYTHVQREVRLGIDRPTGVAGGTVCDIFRASSIALRCHSLLVYDILRVFKNLVLPAEYCNADPGLSCILHLRGCRPIRSQFPTGRANFGLAPQRLIIATKVDNKSYREVTDIPLTSRHSLSRSTVLFTDTLPFAWHP